MMDSMMDNLLKHVEIRSNLKESDLKAYAPIVEYPGELENLAGIVSDSDKTEIIFNGLNIPAVFFCVPSISPDFSAETVGLYWFENPGFWVGMAECEKKDNGWSKLNGGPYKVEGLLADKLREAYTFADQTYTLEKDISKTSHIDLEVGYVKGVLAKVVFATIDEFGQSDVRRLQQFGTPQHCKILREHHNLHNPDNMMLVYNEFLDDKDGNWENTIVLAEIPEEIVTAAIKKSIEKGSSELKHVTQVRYIYHERTAEGGGDDADWTKQATVRIKIKKRG